MEMFESSKKQYRSREWFLPVTLADDVNNFPDAFVPKGAHGMFVSSQIGDGQHNPALAHVYLLQPHENLARNWDNILYIRLDNDTPNADVSAWLTYPNGKSAIPWIRAYYANIFAHMLNFLPLDAHNTKKCWHLLNERLPRSVLHSSCLPAMLSDEEKFKIFDQVISNGIAADFYSCMPIWVWRTRTMRAASKLDVQLWSGVEDINSIHLR